MLNTCVLTGNLGADPEVFYSSEGDPIASFNLAFQSSKKKTGWITVKCFNRLAEVVQTYLHKGARIAIGPEGSGTRKLALDLLHATGIDASNTTLLPLGSKDATSALESGATDAAFFTLAPESPLVAKLIGDARLSLVSLRRAEAYTRRFPYLARVVLPEGAIDLPRNLPATDVIMVAAQAALVARADLHPALAWPLVDALKSTHSAPGMWA